MKRKTISRYYLLFIFLFKYFMCVLVCLLLANQWKNLIARYSPFLRPDAIWYTRKTQQENNSEIEIPLESPTSSVESENSTESSFLKKLIWIYLNWTYIYIRILCVAATGNKIILCLTMNRIVNVLFMRSAPHSFVILRLQYTIFSIKVGNCFVHLFAGIGRTCRYL